MAGSTGYWQYSCPQRVISLIHFIGPQLHVTTGSLNRSLHSETTRGLKRLLRFMQHTIDSITAINLLDHTNVFYSNGFIKRSAFFINDIQ